VLLQYGYCNTQTVCAKVLLRESFMPQDISRSSHISMVVPWDLPMARFFQNMRSKGGTETTMNTTTKHGRRVKFKVGDPKVRQNQGGRGSKLTFMAVFINYVI
jgi:hypothetical protein